MLFLGNILTKEAQIRLKVKIMRTDIQLTTYFKLSEFNFVRPEDDLLRALEILRVKAKNEVIITGSARTILEHIEIYKDDYKAYWLDKIPWSSRHLAEFERGLRAVDLKVRRSEPLEGKNPYWTGKEIYAELINICKRLKLNFGCGIGDYYVHFDIDRERNEVWYY